MSRPNALWRMQTWRYTTDLNASDTQNLAPFFCCIFFFGALPFLNISLSSSCPHQEMYDHHWKSWQEWDRRWSHCNSLHFTATHCNTGGHTAHLFPTGLLKWQVSETAIHVGECCSMLQWVSHCMLDRVLQGVFQRVCMCIISVREHVSTRKSPTSIRLNTCTFIVCVYSINQTISNSHYDS